MLVLLLELFADLVGGHTPRQGVGELSQDSGGGVIGPTQVVAESIILELEILAKSLEGCLDLGWFGGVLLGQGVLEAVHHGDANWS